MNAARLIAFVVPAPLHRIVLRVVHRTRVVWWRVRSLEPDDTRIVALDEQGRVLLVRHSYGSGEWMLPGGGSKRGEDALATATRELREEAGCTLVGAVDISPPGNDARKRRFVVAGRVGGTVRIDRREIVEARFCAPDALPKPTSAWFGPRLVEWVKDYEAR